jgi:hypothetical protein
MKKINIKEEIKIFEEAVEYIESNFLNNFKLIRDKIIRIRSQSKNNSCKRYNATTKKP